MTKRSWMELLCRYGHAKGECYADMGVPREQASSGGPSKFLLVEVVSKRDRALGWRLTVMQSHYASERCQSTHPTTYELSMQ